MNIPSWVMADCEWSATLALLGSPILLRKGSDEWIDFEKREIRFHEVDTTSWSDTEKALFNIANDFFNFGGETIKLTDLVDHLDADHWDLLLTAMVIRRG